MTIPSIYSHRGGAKRYIVSYRQAKSQKQKLHPLQLISKGTSNGQLFELKVFYFEGASRLFVFVIVIVIVIVIDFPKSNLVFLDLLHFIWFIKRGVSLFGLEGTGLKDTADFVSVFAKSAVSFKPVPSSPKSETPRFINHKK